MALSGMLGDLQSAQAACLVTTARTEPVAAAASGVERERQRERGAW
jgi:hypothetical protein